MGRGSSKSHRDILNGLLGEMIGHVWLKYVMSSKIAGPIARQTVINAIVRILPN